MILERCLARRKDVISLLGPPDIETDYLRRGNNEFRLRGFVKKDTYRLSKANEKSFLITYKPEYTVDSYSVRSKPCIYETVGPNNHAEGLPKLDELKELLVDFDCSTRQLFSKLGECQFSRVGKVKHLRLRQWHESSFYVWSLSSDGKTQLQIRTAVGTGGAKLSEEISEASLIKASSYCPVKMREGMEDYKERRKRAKKMLEKWLK